MGVWDKIKEAGSGFINFVKSVAAPVVRFIGNAVSAVPRAIGWAGNQIRRVAAPVVRRIAPAVRQLPSFANKVRRRIGQVEQLGSGVGRTVGRVGETLGREVGYVGDELASGVSNFGKIVAPQAAKLSGLGMIGDTIKGAQSVPNVPAISADMQKGLREGIRKIPKVGGFVGDYITDPALQLSESGTRSLAALTELGKGNVKEAGRQAEQSPLYQMSKERRDKGQNVAQQFLPAVGVGAEVGSLVVPVTKAPKIAKASIKEAAAMGAGANTLFEAGHQAKKDDLNPTALVAAPFAGALGGGALPPLARGAGRMMGKVENIVTDTGRRIVRDLAGDANRGSVTTKLNDMGLDAPTVKVAAPKIAKASTPEEVEQVLRGAGVRRIESSGGLIRPRETRVNIATSKPIVLNKQTGTRPIADMGGDAQLKREISRTVKAGGEVVVEPVKTVKAVRPSKLQVNLGATPVKTGGGKDTTIRVISSTEAPPKVPEAPEVSVPSRSRVSEFIMGKPVADDAVRQTQQTIDEVAPNPSQPTASVPNKGKTLDEVNAEMNANIQARKDMYKDNRLQRAVNKVGRTFDPWREAERIDRAHAKKRKIDYRDLPAEERMVQALNEVENTANITWAKMNQKTSTGLSPAEVIQRHRNKDDMNNFLNYLHMRRDIRLRQSSRKTGDEKRINEFKHMEEDELQKLVDTYEARNTEAVRERKTLVEYNDKDLDAAVKAKLITLQDAKNVRAYYGDDYVPLQRVMPEGVAKPEISGKSQTVSQQKVLQDFDANSTQPIDNTFEGFVNHAQTNTKQLSQARVSDIFYSRIESGATGSRASIEDSVENVKQREALRILKDDITKHRKALEAEVRRTRTQVRVSDFNKRLAESEAVSKARSTLKKAIPKGDVGSRAAIDSMNKQQLLDAFRSLADDAQFSIKGNRMVSKSGAPGLRDTERYLGEATRESKALADQLNTLRSGIKDAQKARKDVADDVYDLRPRTTTGEQVKTMLVDGVKVKVAMTPEVARMMGGFDNKQMSGVIKAALITQRFFQTAWTGFLNVIFPFQSFLFYDVLPSIANARGVTGVRSLTSRNALMEMGKSIRKNEAFQHSLALGGANTTPISGIPIDTKLTQDAIAADANILTSLKFNLTHPRELIQNLDILGGKLAGASRSRNARAAYDRRFQEEIKGGNSEQRAAEMAMKDAVYAYNNVLPNYTRAAPLARELNAVFPYFSASISGTRSLMNGLRHNPTVAIATLSSGLIAPASAITSFNLSSPTGQAFYKDMLETDQKFVLDTNYIIVTNGAKKLVSNPKNPWEADLKDHPGKKEGEWIGIIKLPISPEYRAINQMVWRGVHDMSTDEENQTSPDKVALSIFDFFTGGVRTSQNPLGQTAKIMWGTSPYASFKEGIQGKGKLDPEGHRDFGEGVTSDTARGVSEALGGFFSPIQVDAFMRQFGLAGKIAQNKEGNPLATIAEAAKDKVYGAQGMTEGRRFIEKRDKMREGIKVTPKSDSPEDKKEARKKEDALREAFDVIIDKKAFTDEPWGRQAIATLLLSGELPDDKRPLWGALRGLYGDNPMWQLPDDQLKQVLILRTFQPHWSGLSAPAEEAQKDFIRKQQWFKDFKSKEDAFYESMPADVKQRFKEEGDPDYVVMTDAVEEKLARLNAISDSKEKAKFIKANPDVADYFAQQRVMGQKQREEMGLFRDVTPQQEAAFNEWQGRKDRGEKTGDLFQANPELGALFGAIKGIKGQEEVLEANAEGRPIDSSKLSEGTGGFKKGKSRKVRRKRARKARTPKAKKVKRIRVKMTARKATAPKTSVKVKKVPMPKIKVS